MPKAKRVTPPVEMNEHNAQLRDDTRSTAEAESDAAHEATVAVLTTAQVADELDTTPRTLRKFLRSRGSGVDPVGQGKRYAITAESLPTLAAKFETWEVKANARAADSEDEAEAEVEVEVEELEPEVEAYSEMTVKELRAEAADKGIDIPTKATKADIVNQMIDILTR